MKIRDSDIIRN